MKYYFNVIRSVGFVELVKKIKRRYFGDIKHRRVLKILRAKYSYVYSDLSKIQCPSVSSDEPLNIWVMWWQGEDQMPEVIQACYNSILKASEGCVVNLITSDNLQEYVSLPDYIWDKFKEGKISITHLSDIIRYVLLAEKGGLWLDATTLVTNFNLASLKGQFFVHRFRTTSQSTPTRGRWSNTIVSGVPNLYFKLMQSFFYEYWRKEDSVLKYLLMDYFVLLLYADVPHIKDMIDGVIWSKSNYLLKTIVNDRFESAQWNDLIETGHFHTLTRKRDYIKKTESGNQTYYGYIIDTYIK